MQRKQWKAPKDKDAKKEPAATTPKTAEDGDTAERMRQATRSVGKKPRKTYTLDDVIALLHKHGIRFSDEE